MLLCLVQIWRLITGHSGIYYRYHIAPGLGRLLFVPLKVVMKLLYNALEQWIFLVSLGGLLVSV